MNFDLGYCLMSPASRADCAKVVIQIGAEVRRLRSAMSVTILAMPVLAIGPSRLPRPLYRSLS